MSNFMMVDCIHCRQQTTIDIKKPGDTCLFCGKPAKLKEVIMQEKVGKQYKDMDRMERSRYIKAHLAEIVADIKAMDGADIIAKWGFGRTTCYMLRKKYAPGTIGKPRGTKAKEHPAPAVEEKKAEQADVSLTEHERYLMLLGWQGAVRELLHIVQP